MSAMSELNFFLGLQVLQKEDGIFLSQDKYVRDILKKFGYSDVRSSNTPMNKENPWGKDETGKDVDLHFYRSMIGSLMYLTTSRPDIMFSVCAYARHQVTLKECHLHTVKRIFRYLKGHPKLGLWYPKESPFGLVAYSDSDYGGATQDRKSTTKGYQFFGRRLISWQCKKQTIVATSTTEAEYFATASGYDAPIKGRRLDEGEEAAERVSDDTEEMATVLTSIDAASILTSEGVQVVPTATEVATASIAWDAEIARIHVEEELQMLIDGLDRNNETVAKLSKESPSQRKLQKDFYMSVLKSHAGWKARHFKGMTLEEIKEKFDPVWKPFQDFIPIGSNEEEERFKREGVRLEQDNSKKLKTSEEVPEEKLKEMMELILVEEVYVEALQVKHPIIDWEVHTEGERSYWKIVRLGGSTTSYQFFVDLLKHFDREDLNQLWALVKETLNIRQATSDKEIELWVELKRLDKFPLPEQLSTAYEDKFPLLIQSDATVKKIALLLKIGVSHGQRHIYIIQRRMIVTQLFRESVL
nr:hypothetical protein [Tanacetum cinerariifolium]